MFDKLKGSVDGIKDRAKEIADETSEANTRKHNEQRMAAAAAQNEAKEAAKEKLSGSAATTLIRLGIKAVNGVKTASETAKNISTALAVEPLTSAKAPKGLPIKADDEPEDKRKPEPITAKVPGWM